MKNKNKKVSTDKFEFIITNISFTSENDHGIITAKIPYQYSKIKNWKKGDTILIKHIK